MTLVPTFRHFRVLNIISLVGTAYTAVYLMAISGDQCRLTCMTSHILPTVFAIKNQALNKLAAPCAPMSCGPHIASVLKWTLIEAAVAIGSMRQPCLAFCEQ